MSLCTTFLTRSHSRSRVHTRARALPPLSLSLSLSLSLTLCLSFSLSRSPSRSPSRSLSLSLSRCVCANPHLKCITFSESDLRTLSLSLSLSSESDILSGLRMTTLSPLSALNKPSRHHHHNHLLHPTLISSTLPTHSLIPSPPPAFRQQNTLSSLQQNTLVFPPSLFFAQEVPMCTRHACTHARTHERTHERAPSPTLSPTDPVPRGLLTLWAGLHVCVCVCVRAHTHTRISGKRHTRSLKRQMDAGYAGYVMLLDTMYHYYIVIYSEIYTTMLAC